MAVGPYNMWNVWDVCLRKRILSVTDLNSIWRRVQSKTTTSFSNLVNNPFPNGYFFSFFHVSYLDSYCIEYRNKIIYEWPLSILPISHIFDILIASAIVNNRGELFSIYILLYCVYRMAHFTRVRIPIALFKAEPKSITNSHKTYLQFHSSIICTHISCIHLQCLSRAKHQLLATGSLAIGHTYDYQT